jgi:selenocysteine-specific elongation factor
MIIATAGHVDHGKTLLIKALTGVDTDRLPEEKKRGLTIDLGFAYHDLGDGKSTGFIDVPGHERFVKTMIAGAVGIDAVLFIVAADDGPMPQTEEHLAILELLGIEKGVVALTKIDRVSEERVAEVKGQCVSLFETTCLKGLPVIPVSVPENIGVEKLRIELLGLRRISSLKKADNNFRMAIDRSFTLKGAGQVVTGTIFDGRVEVDDVLNHIPSGGELRVRSLRANNEDVGLAIAGQREALNLVSSKKVAASMNRGDWVVSSAANFVVKRLDVRIQVLANEGKPLANRTPVHLHLGAADVTGRVITFDRIGIAPGNNSFAQLILDEPIHAIRGDRFVLRDQAASRTFAGGVVVEVFAKPYRAKYRDQRIAQLDAVSATTIEVALQSLVHISPHGVDLSEFAKANNHTLENLLKITEAISSLHVVAREPPLVFSAEQITELRDRLIQAMKKAHKAGLNKTGLSDSMIKKEFDGNISLELIRPLLESAVGENLIERVEGLFRLKTFKAKRSRTDELLWQRVEPLITVKDFKVPVLHELQSSLNIDMKLLKSFLLRSTKDGYIVQISERRYFATDAVEKLKQLVVKMCQDGSLNEFTVADFRSYCGIGRNAVVEILEYFDRVGFTRREGSSRKILKKKNSS